MAKDEKGMIEFTVTGVESPRRLLDILKTKDIALHVRFEAATHLIEKLMRDVNEIRS